MSFILIKTQICQNLGLKWECFGTLSLSLSLSLSLTFRMIYKRQFGGGGTASLSVTCLLVQAKCSNLNKVSACNAPTLLLQPDIYEA